MNGQRPTGSDGDAPQAGIRDGVGAGRAVRVEQLVAASTEARPGAGRRPGAGVAGLLLGVVALVALVAALSPGLPDRVRGGGGGLSVQALLGDAAAVVIVLALAGVAFMAYSEWAGRERRPARRAPRRRRLRPRRPRFDAELLAVPLLLAIAGALLLALIALLGGTSRPVALHLSSPAAGLSPLHAARPAGGGGRVPLDPIALIVVAAIVGVAAAALAVRARRRRATSDAAPAQDALVAAVDDSLEDLAREPDPRRAVIKAYDRMERALAAGGTPRDRAETPIEYLRRALAAVRASQGSIRRLTDLFEQARFSRHTIDGTMKQEAIAALTALRTELEGAGAA